MITVDLHYLAASAAFVGVMWIPYVLNRIAVGGLADAMGYPADPKPLAGWAQRLKCAHANAVENLVVFGAVVLVAHAAGLSNESTATAAAVYFYARIVHALAYTFAIPWVRTLSFAAGWAAIVWMLVVMHGPMHAAMHGG